MRIGTAMIGMGLSVVLVAPAWADETASGLSDLLGWLDRNLEAGARASTAPSQPPALGEGMVGRALAAEPATEVAATPEPAAPIAPAAPRQPAVPVAAPAAAVSADDAPLPLVSGGGPATAARSGGGLLLPLD